MNARPPPGNEIFDVDANINTIFCLPVFFSFFKKVQQSVGSICKVMNAVSVIPEYSEILCFRRKISKTLYRFVRAGDALGVAVHRYAPDTLDKLIFAYQLFYNVHIGTVGGIRYCNHLNAEALADSKMSVITGAGQRNFTFSFFPQGLSPPRTPRSIALAIVSYIS